MIINFLLKKIFLSYFLTNSKTIALSMKFSLNSINRRALLGSGWGTTYTYCIISTLKYFLNMYKICKITIVFLKKLVLVCFFTPDRIYTNKFA